MDAAYDKLLDEKEASLAEEWSRTKSGNTPKDMNASNACNRCKGKDVDRSGDHDVDESCATTAASRMKQTVTDVRHSRVKLWANTFNVNIRDHEEEQFEHERYYLAAEVVAQKLTSHPTMPNRLLATHTPEEAAQSGIWLGTNSCAFKG